MPSINRRVAGQTLKHFGRWVYDDEGIFISNEKNFSGGFKTMSRRARVRGIEIAYDVAGEEDGEPVVLLHGFPFNRAPLNFLGVVGTVERRGTA